MSFAMQVTDFSLFLSLLRHSHVPDGASSRVVGVSIRPREHGIQERRRGRIPVELLLAVRTDRVPLVQDVGTVGTVLSDQGVRVSNHTDLVVDGLVRVHGHLRDAVQTHGAVVFDDGGHLRTRQHGLTVDKVEIDVLELIARLSLAQGIVLRREEVGLGVGALGVGGELAVDVLLSGGPLA